LADGASVVFVSSLSRYVSYPGASVYAGTKDGIASYARSLAVGFPALHVMTVYPGPTRTEHARKYSPDNSREGSRMLPSDLAGYVMRGVEKRQRIVIPGAANWAFAAFGRLLPGVAENVMRQSLLEKFESPAG
ncbi:MAG: SDR family NAD(P)-dependent oxidoreductase, partial [Chloroflexota bacterium]